MADYTKQDIFDIITEYLEQYGSAIGSAAVRELTAAELADVSNMRILTIPGMIPLDAASHAGEWVQTNMANMITPITSAVSDWNTLEAAIRQTIADAQGADNVDANLSTQGSAVLITVTNRAGVSTTQEIGFRILRTYETVAAMNADAANVAEGRFVMISGDVEQPDTGKLYVRNSASAETPFGFLTDLSGAQGIRGPEPVLTADNDGAIYSDGNLLTDVIKNAVAAFTSWFGATANAGVRKTWSDWYSAAQNAWNTFFGASASEGVRKTWSDWFSDSLSTGVRKLWNDFWSSVNTNWNSFFGETANAGVRKTWSDWYSAAQTAWSNWFGVSDSAGVRKTWSDWYTATQSAWNDWFSNSLSTGVRKIWTTWFSGVQTDWNTLSSQAASDHQTALSDHTQADTDHGTASNDHATANSDHTQASTDHQNALTAISGAENVNATLSGTTITVTNRNGQQTTANLKGDKGDKGDQGDQGLQGVKGDKGDKGDALNYSDMSAAEKQQLAEDVRNTMIIASVATCESIIDEITNIS